MHWTNQINRVAGIALLLLAAALIASIATSASFEDSDPFDRDEIDDFLQDVNDNEALAIVNTVVDIVADVGIGIVAAAALYLVFRERNRLLALFGFAFLLGGTIGFFAADAASVPLIVLAEDFVEKGGPGNIAAGDDVILMAARAVATWSLVVDQMAFSAVGLGVLSIGWLIASTPAGATANPPRWIGWLAVLGGTAAVASWLGAAAEAFFVLFIVAGIAILVFLISLGVWLLRQPPAPSHAVA